MTGSSFPPLPPPVPPWHLPPLQYAPPIPRPRRPWRLGLAMTWLSIFAAVGTVAFLQWRGGRRAAPVVTDPHAPASFQLRANGRMLVGFKAWFPNNYQPMLGSQKVAIEQLDTAATNAVDRLRVVAVVGELFGKDAALGRFDAHPHEWDAPDLQRDAAALRSIYVDGPATLSMEQRQALLDHHSWFGNLALGFDQPDADAHRAAALALARRTALIFGAFMAVVLGAMLVGLALLIWGLIRLADRKLPMAYRPTLGDTRPFLEAFAIYVVGYVALSALATYAFPHVARFNVVRMLIVALIPPIVAMLWPLYRGVDRAAWRQGLGWHAGRGAAREIAWGLIGYLAGLPALALGLIVTGILVKASGAKAGHPIQDQIGGAGTALELFVLAAVYAPLVEETMFRGALLHYLRGGWGWFVSASLVSLLFAAMHPQGWAGVPVLFAIAMTLAAIREWRGTILASAAAHALNNGVMVAFLIGTSW